MGTRVESTIPFQKDFLLKNNIMANAATNPNPRKSKNIHRLVIPPDTVSTKNLESSSADHFLNRSRNRPLHRQEKQKQNHHQHMKTPQREQRQTIRSGDSWRRGGRTLLAGRGRRRGGRCRGWRWRWGRRWRIWSPSADPFSCFFFFFSAAVAGQTSPTQEYLRRSAGRREDMAYLPERVLLPALFFTVEKINIFLFFILKKTYSIWTKIISIISIGRKQRQIVF